MSDSGGRGGINWAAQGGYDTRERGGAVEE